MRTGNDNVRPRPAFTLVELILVMALLTILTAVAVPLLSRSLRNRGLEQEAIRLLALTEYARDEAVSLGVPMTVWIEPETGRFGADAQSGYISEGVRKKEVHLNPDVHFDKIEAASVQNGIVNAIQFAPDGTPDVSSVTSMRLVDRFNSSVTVALSTDGWAYEIVK
jgi:type II secretion system protein H